LHRDLDQQDDLEDQMTLDIRMYLFVGA